MNPALTTLLEDSRLWRGGAVAGGTPKAVPATDAVLARQLPGGGWPVGAMTEVLYECRGCGEVSLLLPAIAKLSAAGRYIAWIGAPYPPYAPALVAAGVDVRRVLCVDADKTDSVVWAAEQVLRAGVCGLVLVWLEAAPMRCLRRLQLAAPAGEAPTILLRPAAVAGVPSPAGLRLCVTPQEDGLRIRILKCRGRSPTEVRVPIEPGRF